MTGCAKVDQGMVFAVNSGCRARCPPEHEVQDMQIWWSVYSLVRQAKLRLWLVSRLARFVTMQALIGATVLQGSGHAQSGMGPLRDSVSVYRAREETVGWLLEYDRVAWLTSDEVMQQSPEVLAELGQEWFCLKVGDRWHAFYGLFLPEADTYHAVLHYEMDAAVGVRASKDTLDPADLDAFGRAIAWTYAHLPDHFRHAGFPLNRYVRALGDTALEVWYLPGWNPAAGLLMYGGEIRFLLERDGRGELSRHVLLDPWRGHAPDSTQSVNLDYERYSLPTVGSLFYTLSNRRAFKQIYIYTRDYVTTFVDTPEGPSWMHAVRSNKRDTRRQHNGWLPSKRMKQRTR
jgi:hypothetical protein